MSKLRDQMLRSFMAGLIEKAGGVEPAAALISARRGTEVSKGTISKRQAGHLDWSFADIWALEEAVGDPCVRRWGAQSLPEIADGQSLMQAGAELSREFGEAQGAIMDLASGRGSPAKARKEMQDLVIAAERMASIVADQDDPA